MQKASQFSVFISSCPDYDVADIRSVFEKALAALKFDTSSLNGKRVLLKPNMLGAYPPHMGITTHPKFLEAAIILFKDFGARIWVGDSPNGIFPIDSVWQRTGVREICKRHGVEEKVFEREGGVFRDGIFIAKPVLDADLIVNLPKFKTHGLTVLTIAAKNLFGCVPGLQKTRYHRDNIDRIKFSKILVRVAQIARPALNLVDGIIAMEGNGPSAGRLVRMNTIIAGVDHNAVDAVCAKIIGLDPLNVDTLSAAAEMGLWRASDKINILGEHIEKIRPASFNLPKTFTNGMLDWWLSRFVLGRIWGGISIKPKINNELCEQCDLCTKACPVDAISEKKNFPYVITEKCVECYCCHEVCPNQAIDLNESLGVKIGRFIGERRIKRLKSQALNPKF